MPSASVTAKPKMRLPNCFGASVGLRSAPCRKLPKMMPTPTPAPPMPMQAMPAPMYFAATGSITNSFWFCGRALVTRVNRIVEIDAGENGEDVGLQEGHQRLQRIKNDNHCERQQAADPTDRAKAS